VLKGFVTFEGIDGSGKTTVSRLVAETLGRRGEKTFLTEEPTKRWTGDAVRRAYREDVGPLAEAFLFLADRAAHQADLRRHLDEGEIVLCDRYADSTYAYQGARLAGVVEEPVSFLQRMARPWLVLPDLTLLLRISPEIALQRISDRPEHVRFEELTFLRKVARNYDTLSKSRRYVVLDARQGLNDLSAQAVAAIDRRLAPRRR
jgi:dTMP kinase